MGLKKILKKVGKAAVGAGLAYAAAKGLGKKSKTADVEGGRGANLRGILKAAMPGNLSKSAGPYKDAVGQGMNRKNWKNWYDDSAGAKDGGRMGYKSGGAAKRGVSPILLKGKR